MTGNAEKVDKIYMNHNFATDCWKIVLLMDVNFASPYFIDNKFLKLILK